MAYNNLINISFEDAVLHANTDNSDILGMILPFHWGPAGEIKVLNQQDFYNTYPESNPRGVILENVAEKYAQIKSYFANGGSRVAVYRPVVSGEWFGNTTDQLGPSGGNYLTFKYPGLPFIEGTLQLSVTATTPGSPTTNYEVSLNNGAASNPHIYERFSGQMYNPSGADNDGITTYLPLLLEQKAKYIKISNTAPAPIPQSANWIAEGTTLKADAAYTGPDVVASALVRGTTYYKSANTVAVLNTDYGFPYMPGVGTATLDSVFGDSDTLIPTQFLEYSATLDDYKTATFYIDYEANTNIKSRFAFLIQGNTGIQSFSIANYPIGCAAGVAGAYARVAKDVHLNQVASARSYGAFNGTLTSSYTMSDAIDGMNNDGLITVFNSSTGPQIFGVNNSWFPDHSGSYFSKCNVSRVLAAILRQIIPLALDTIHTDTAANPITRRVFETALNGVINGFISSQDLQSDSKAICDGTNNDDTQTDGGRYLNIILSLHFIGLVEKVNIRVVATDSSVTVNFA